MKQELQSVVQLKQKYHHHQAVVPTTLYKISKVQWNFKMTIKTHTGIALLEALTTLWAYNAYMYIHMVHCNNTLIPYQHVQYT